MATRKNQTSEKAGAASTSKIDTVIALLKRSDGATLDQLMTATGWQKHSVRGAMSGTLKKKQGMSIASEKSDGVRVYRIVEGAPA